MLDDLKWIEKKWTWRNLKGEGRSLTFYLDSFLLKKERGQYGIKEGEEERDFFFVPVRTIPKNEDGEIDYPFLVQLFKNDLAEFSKALFEAIWRPQTYYTLLEEILCFVQSIPYKIPPSEFQRRKIAGLLTPMEVLYYNYEDCDSKSLLFACIWKNLAPGIPCVFFIYEKHVNVGVENVFNAEGKQFVVDGKTYLVCETTAKCAPPGTFRGENPLGVMPCSD